MRFQFILLGVAVSIFISTPSWPNPSAPISFGNPLKAWLDPFWQGVTTSVSYMNRENSYRILNSSQVYVAYGFQNGIALDLNIPVYLTDTNPSTTGALTPRIGGGPIDRIEIDGSFRLWGDAIDYFAISLGLGLPFQSDLAEQNTNLNSWQIPISVFGRWDWKWIALTGKLSNYVATPTVVNFSGNNFYLNSSNLVVFSANVYFYPLRTLSPSLGVSETFPVSTDTGTDINSRTFLTKSNSSPRSISASANIDFAPFSNGWVFSAEGSYFFDYSPAQESPLQIIGKIRWVF